MVTGKQIAIIRNIILPGWSDFTLDKKNPTTQIIFTVGIITTVIGLYYCYKISTYFGYFNPSDILKPLFNGFKITYVFSDVKQDFRNLYTFLVIFLLVPRIIFAYEIIYRWNKLTGQGSSKTESKLKSENKVETNIKPINDNGKTNKFIPDLTKVYNLKVNGVYSEEEYLTRKKEMITDLINKDINEKLEDFLLGLIPLKEKGILSLEDITQIKSSYIAKENSSHSENSPTNAEENTDSEITYICSNCNDEMELEPEEIKNNKFVCPNCGTLNKI